MLATASFYSALNKPQMFMGGERELMMMTALISLALIFQGMTWATAFAGIVMWVVLASLIRMMAKRDPLMSKIFIRQSRYKKYYRAKASAFAE